MAAVWPLVGREQELRFVAGALRARSTSPGVVLAGAAGVGKTRLAREATSRAAAQRGSQAGWAYGTASARSTPLGAFEALIGPLGPNQADIVHRAAEHLRSRLGPHPLIAVDDAHALDDLSALLVHQLVVRDAATLVITLRSGVRAPDAITALWKDQHLPRLEIQGLSAAEATSLLEQVLGAAVDSAAAGRLWSLSQGNLLFLRHLVEGALRSGRLHEVEGIWVLPEIPALTPELSELVSADMGELTRSVRNVVDLLALGEPIGLDALGMLTEPGAVELAEQRGLIRIGQTPPLAARLAHPLYGEVARVAIGQVRARRLRGLIATTLESAAMTSAHNSPTQLLRWAVLAVDSDLISDPARLLAAARLAIGLFDLALGERLARAAAEAGGGFDARLTQAFALSWLSRGEEAEARLVSLAASAPDPATAAVVTVARAGNLFWTLGRTDEAEQVLTQHPSSTDGATTALLAAMTVLFNVSLGRPQRVLDAALPLLDNAEAPRIAVLLAASGAAAAGAVQGRTELVRQVAEQGYRSADQAPEGGIPRFGLADWHILALRLSGDVRDAEELGERVRRWTADVLGPARLMGLVLTGQVELACGRGRTAERFLAEAWAALRDSGHEFRFRCRMHLTQALAVQGRSQAARALLTDLEAERHAAYTLLEPEIALARAWVVASEGATSEAVMAAHTAAGIARSHSSPAYEVFALQSALEFGDHGVGPRLAELARHVEGPRASTAAQQARATAAGDGDELLALASRWHDLGDDLAAADAAAQAALAWTGQGRRGSAAAAASQAQRFGEACEGARTPAMTAAARPLPLTEREREIVTLAAGGSSNRVIATRLGVSVRTIEGHLYRAGAKLGVSDRSQLTSVLSGRAVEQPTTRDHGG